MILDIYQVDAFANVIFEGNPAAVCVLDDWLPEVLMQAIANEMNLAETAFLVKKDEGFRIRWFTPTTEVKLCGHATLAAAHVLYNHLDYPSNNIRFRSLSGLLEASKTPDGISLDFPAATLRPTQLTRSILDALGGDPIEALEDQNLVVVYSDATEIEILSPDFAKIAEFPHQGVCVTAPGNGNGYDFVSRYFAPSVGIDEDPVTGSSFTELVPYYAGRMDKTEFSARQVSKRGGDVFLRLGGNRVHIAGRAKTVMHGQLRLK